MQAIERHIELASRGTIRVRDVAGPVGAPSLLLLHGLAATGTLNWGRCFEPLSQYFRVISVDHRGHGRGVRTGRFRLVDCADDAFEVTRALKLDRFIAVGYSMGGPVASLLWKRHREAVAGLVFCATARDFGFGGWSRATGYALPLVAQAARLVPDQIRKQLRDRMLGDVKNPKVRAHVHAELAGHNPATVLQAAGAVVRFSSREWIGEVDVPSAVVVTTRDRLVTPGSQRKLAAAIEGSRVFEIAADHIACVSRADLFVPALLSACRDVAARA